MPKLAANDEVRGPAIERFASRCPVPALIWRGFDRLVNDGQSTREVLREIEDSFVEVLNTVAARSHITARDDRPA